LRKQKKFGVQLSNLKPGEGWMKSRLIKPFRKIPGVIPIGGFLQRKVRKWWLRLLPKEKIFTNAYKANVWGDESSASGPGSNLDETTKIREELPKLFHHLQITSILDIPCGDFFWMKEVNLDGIMYFGADIVQELIVKNRKYENGNRSFMKLNVIIDDLPEVDLVLVRDCFVHFSITDIYLAINNIYSSKSKYLLTTTFTSRDQNADIETSHLWRPLNFQCPPFSFPNPNVIINENHPQSDFSDKSLGLWNLEDLVNII
jgi:hypothetical protein